ncbi:MAG: FHA domain-containing protein [Thermoanaerobaculia bacterium]
MAEVICKFCGVVVALGDAAVGDRVSAECRSCGSLFWTTAPEPTGFETIRQRPAREPELPPAEESPPPPPAPPRVDDPTLRPPTGTVLLIPGQEPAQPGPAPPRTLRRANLVVEGPQSSHLPITGTRTEVGRRGAHLVIADPALSASHFVIEAHGETYVIRDLGSSNGTRLNGHDIQSSRLVSGDLIEAGATRFSFRIEEVIPLDAAT